MKDNRKPKTQLIAELTSLRQQTAELEQKLIEQAYEDNLLAQIEQAKQEWEATADSLPQIVCLLDTQKRIIRANRTVERWNLARIVEVPGKGLHPLLHPDCPYPTCYLKTFLHRVWAQLAQGQSIEYEAQDDVLNRYLYWQIRPVVAQLEPKDRVPTSFATVVIHDITERKRMEEALQGAKEELEQRVEERTAQLRRVALENARLYETQREQYRRLQQSHDELIRIEKMAALGRLVASIGHEINNPLQSVQGFLNLLDEEINGRHRQEKLQYYLEIADGEIDRISTIVRRMRDFYRSTTRKPQTEPDSLDSFYRSVQTDLQIIDLHATLESVLQLTNKKLQHSNITVERVWAGTLPAIQVNPDHLKQVFLNLTLNAIDTMQAQGGTLRIVTISTQTKLWSDQPQPVVQIEFSDTGQGMPPEVLSRLFEPLFTTKEQGSGFGLFTSYEIIEAHHGRFTVASQVGQGTTLTIVLPVEQP